MPIFGISQISGPTFFVAAGSGGRVTAPDHSDGSYWPAGGLYRGIYFKPEFRPLETHLHHVARNQLGRFENTLLVEVGSIPATQVGQGKLRGLLPLDHDLGMLPADVILICSVGDPCTMDRGRWSVP